MTRPLTLDLAQRTLLSAALRHAADRWPRDPARADRLRTADWLDSLPKRAQRIALTEEGIMDAADCLAYHAVSREEVTSEALALLTKLTALPSVQARVARKLEAARRSLKGKGGAG